MRNQTMSPARVSTPLTPCQSCDERAMQNHLRNSPSIYRRPARTLEIAGPALPRWTPPYLDMLSEGEDTRAVLIPVSLEGHEAIGQPYRYVVQCRTDIDGTVNANNAGREPAGCGQHDQDAKRSHPGQWRPCRERLSRTDATGHGAGERGGHRHHGNRQHAHGEP
ncbi:hypothetical protein PCAR4_80002 [Paraburkholderia caribensis]|nr:hypothetical protein PCAR4_80002 [Paraburkholderia caribensis]